MEYPVLCVGPASSNFERYRVKSLNYICSFKQGHTCRERERERERERDVQGHTYTRTQHNNRVTFFICICQVNFLFIYQELCSFFLFFSSINQVHFFQVNFNLFKVLFNFLGKTHSGFIMLLGQKYTQKMTTEEEGE